MLKIDFIFCKEGKEEMFFLRGKYLDGINYEQNLQVRQCCSKPKETMIVSWDQNHKK
jgi:hypothetical protein